ncbi:MAG TPA: response regulator [Verrucomicrobiae bacterium]|jgi:PAS domain S-box-containing protein|nr:response regulator [Verrucomicrobiae bacterium]
METKDTNQAVRILHLEDTYTDQLFVQETLLSEHFVATIENVKTREDFESALRTKVFDLIISDYSLPSFDGVSALAIARQVRPEIPFIFFSGTIGEELAVDGLRGGAVDYVLKQRPARLLPAIRRAIQDARERARLRGAEEKIRQQAALLDKASDAIILCDMDRQILFWNKGAERIYGWTTEEVVGKNLVDLLFSGNPPPETSGARKCLDERGEWSGELQEFTKDHRTVTVQARATLIRDEQSYPKSLFIINTDITERKQLEEQFLRSQRLESLGALISGIAHDLNNALSPVMMGIDILRQNPKPEDARPIFDMVEASTRRGADMVKQVLAFARGADTRKSAVQLDRLVKEMGKIITDVFPKNIKCEVNVAPGTWPVSGLATQLHQVLMNLCVNARDAMPKGGTLKLATKNVQLNQGDVAQHPDVPAGDYVCVSVEDSGTGISEEQLAKIFQPFFTTKGPGKGTGLGLSTSRNILQNHGGFISVETQPGSGTTFKFCVPAAKAAESPEVSNNAFLPAGSGECVLVIDDEESVLAITKSTLENFGYAVIKASSGPEAVATFAEQKDRIQIIITDMSMPFMDGVATTMALRKIRADVPIIITSGLSQDQDTDTNRRIKAAAFLQKPFTAENLLTQVHAVLTREGSTRLPHTNGATVTAPHKTTTTATAW